MFALDVMPASMTHTTSSYGIGYEAQGNVLPLLNATSSGGAKASYGYTPYGQQANGLSAGDTNKHNPINPYRFMAKRWDSGSGGCAWGHARLPLYASS
jgi:hypothetical protein